MRAYVIKRLLLMIPTFIGISLVVFVILNLAPGRPGGAQLAADLTSSVRGEVTQESHRIFRWQFNLDKPVLWNMRFALQREDVHDLLRTVAGRSKGGPGAEIEAHETLDDWGAYVVPHLVSIMREESDPLIRDLAVFFLRGNAPRRPLDPFARNPAPAVRAENQRREVENQQLRVMRYALEDPEERKLVVIERWSAWYEEHQGRFQYTTLDKIRVFFFETRFATYWRNLVKLDFGVSLVTREPVLDTLLGKLRYSLSLSVTSVLLAYLISIPIGIHSAVARDSFSERASTVTVFMMYSLPTFFVGTLALFYLSQGSEYEALRWFPTGGWRSANADELTALGQIGDVLWHLILPVAVMTYGSLAALSRYMRTGLLNVLASDYVRTARAKGLPEGTVILKHALRNGLLPVLTLLAGLLPAVLGGSVIVEVIFGIPGMGAWFIDSIYQRDYNVIMAVQLISTVLVLVGILLSDLSYALVDPRIRYQ